MLKIWLPLNGDLHNQGLADVTVTNNGATVNNAGKIGKCYEFGTTTNSLSVTPDFIKDISGGCSFAFWVKFTDYGVNYQTIFDINDGGISWNNEIFAFQKNASNKRLVFTMAGTNGYTSGSCVTQSDFELNKWYHFVCVYDPGKMSIYKDGEHEYTYNTTVIPKVSAVKKFVIGAATTTGTYQSKSLINDFRLYDHALSAKEIKELSKGLVLHYPLNRGGFGGDNLLKNSNALAITGSDRSASSSRTFDFNTHIGRIEVLDTTTNYWNAWRFLKTDLSEDPVDLTTGINTYTYSVDVRVTNYTTGTIQTSIDFRTSSPTVILKHILQESECDGNWHRISATATTNDQKNTQALVSFSSGSTIHGSNTVIEYKNLKLERGDKATPWIPNSADVLYSDMGLDDGIEYDVSGYRYNGNVTGALTYSSDTPRYLTSTAFNGTSYTSLTSPCAEVKTISFWAYWDAIPSGQSVLFVDGKSHIGFGLMSTGILCGTSGIGNFKTFSKTSLVANKWYHFVIVNPGDATSLDRKLYIDGVEQTATTSTSNWSYGVDQLQLGKRVSTSDGFKGKMSDFRMYSTALSADDILALYHTPTSIANNGTLMTQGEISEV